MIDKTLDKYRIVAHLGHGGMGEVYRALDTKLQREVAIKVLPPELAHDAHRVARFQREARVLASLQHPNVASLYGFEEAEGEAFLVMELVEGEELGERIARGRIGFEEVREIAVAIARGLEAAHAKGIVHRDLKPANVRLTPNNQAKVLDFGLACAMADETEDVDPTTSPTITAAMTQQGMILGTAGYMSPEQARGKSVDHRADIWAFGVLLYEMLTGRTLFEGETVSDVLANVLKQEIDFESLPPDVPPSMQWVLERCLVRDPRRRLHSIADARLELERGDTQPAKVVETADRGTTAAWVWPLLAVLAISTGVLGWLQFGPDSEDPREVAALAIPIDSHSPLSLADYSAFSVSDDGKTFALTISNTGQPTIAVRRLDSKTLIPISGQGNALGAFCSPDGKWVGFYRDNHLYKVSADGGARAALAESSYPRGADWSDDGYIYYSPQYSTGLFRVKDDGSAPADTLTHVDTSNGERTHRWPSALPGSRGALFCIGMTNSPGAYDNAELAVYDARSGQAHRLGIQGTCPRFAPPGHLLFVRAGVLYAVEFDLSGLTVQGSARPVLNSVRGDPGSGMYYYDIDRAGNLYYVQTTEEGPQRRLGWIDRDGKASVLSIPPDRYRYPRLSPDDEQAILVLGEGQGGGGDDVYLLDLQDYSLNRLSFDGSSFMPLWFGSGDAVLYASVGTQAGLMRRELSGASGAEFILRPHTIAIPGQLLPDDHTLLATALGAPTLGDIWAIDLEDSSAARPLVQSDAAEWSPTSSPDGKWFAYCSDESGQEEIFVAPYPPTGARWQISHDGGRGCVWSRRGNEIFFIRGDEMWSAQVKTTPEFRAQRPELLFRFPFDNAGVPQANYDVSADGSRFLVVEADEGANADRIEVLQNWASGL